MKVTRRDVGLRDRVVVRFSRPRDDTDIEDAREWLRGNLSNAPACPVCEQTAALRRRVLYDKMVAWLVWLVHTYEKKRRWINVHEGPVFQARRGGGDYCKLRYWGFITPRPNRSDPTRKTLGEWKPTERGIEFVRGQLRVPRACFTFNDRVYSWSKDTTNLREALGERFDVNEIIIERS